MALRRLLRSEFEIQSILDLGDTKFFAAAVLPVIVVARKKEQSRLAPARCRFDRVYESRQHSVTVRKDYNSLFDAILDENVSGAVGAGPATFIIERGVLADDNEDYVWSLSNSKYDAWLKTVESHRVCSFDDVAKTRVGIKTTADEVIVRRDWSAIPIEAPLLRPLLTHDDVERWLPLNPGGSAKVLYPHTELDGKRRPISLSDYPDAAVYLRRHEVRLRQRKYVIDAGRKWYEIWVPHQPGDWVKPKIVFPDISEIPRFFWDATGALVSGECYWITLRPGEDADWLPLILAIANSSFATRYYDIAFHNKLYAGRRRFQTQYVKKKPLPDLQSRLSRQIVECVKQCLAAGPSDSLNEELDALVWKSFGLV